jgi:hypothetical protein
VYLRKNLKPSYKPQQYTVQKHSLFLDEMTQHKTHQFINLLHLFLVLRIGSRALYVSGGHSDTWVTHTTTQSFCLYFVFETGSCYLLLRLASNLWSSYLCLLCSWDYNCAPPWLARTTILIKRPTLCREWGNSSSYRKKITKNWGNTEKLNSIVQHSTKILIKLWFWFMNIETNRFKD